MTTANTESQSPSDDGISDEEIEELVQKYQRQIAWIKSELSILKKELRQRARRRSKTETPLSEIL